MQAVAAFFASIITFVSGFFVPAVAPNSPVDARATQPAAAAAAQTDITGDPFNDAAAASAVAAALAAAPSSAVSPPPAQTTINQPVVERIIERIVPQGAGSVSTETLAAILADFEQSISSRIAALNPPKVAIPEQIAAAGSATGAFFPASQRIDQLTNTAIYSPIINSPTISGGTISNATVSGTLSGTFSGTSSFTAATTSSLAISSIPWGLLSTDGSGNIVATSTPTATSFIATSTIASQFPYASSTALTVSGTGFFGTASSSALVVSNSFTFRNVTGFLKATAGVVATSLINLASDVTGILPIANGGTATSTQVTNGVNFFDGTRITSGTALTFDGTTLTAPRGAFSSTSGTTTIATGQGFTIGASQFVVQQGSGNVGIGTTTPAYVLDVNGDVNVASGKCFRVAGTCIGYIVKLSAIRTGTSTAVWSKPSNLSYAIVELWGAGGGGGRASLGSGGGNGGDSNFGGLATSTGGSGGQTPPTTPGTGQGGDINLAGFRDTSPGSNGGVTANGGCAPRGGCGDSPTTTGQPYGGGGGNNNSGSGGFGGGYMQKLFTASALSGTSSVQVLIGAGGTAGSNGTAGGPGGYVIYEYATSSPTAAGNDYAENFPVSDPGITAGDIVAVDTGVPVSLRFARKGDQTLAGIISTAPGQVLGDKDAIGMRPVALAGRVPTKVSLENGPIALGDRIAVSSTPGVGMKAGPFDDAVGIALEAADQDGTIMTFVTLSRGIDINAIAMTLLGTDASLFAASTTASTTAITSATTGPLDFVGGMMSAIATRISLADSTGTASTTATATSTSPADSYASNFLRNIFTHLIAWFANSTNGIGDFFARVGRFDETDTKKLCIGSTCVTEDELKVLLAAAGQQAFPSAPLSTPSISIASSTPVLLSPPVIEINGNNPAIIHIDDAYTDLGATIIGPQEDLNLGITTLLDGATTTQISIDTSQPREHTISYTVTSPTTGLTGRAMRTVVVSPAEQSPEPPANDNPFNAPPANDNVSTSTLLNTEPAVVSL